METELRPGFVSLFNEGSQGVSQLGPKVEGLGKEQGAAHHLSGKEVVSCVKPPCYDVPSPKPPCFR